MSQQSQRVRTFEAAAAITRYTRVKIDTNGKAAVAAESDETDGIAQDTVASGDPVAVLMVNAAATAKLTAVQAITKGAKAYAASSGKIGTTSANALVGIAIEAASADGDVIEVNVRQH